MRNDRHTVGQRLEPAVPSAARQREDRPLPARLAEAGVDRRAFLKFCAGVTAGLALPPQFAPRVASALAKVTRPVVVWLEFQDCAGDTEAFVRSRDPSAADLVLGLISLDYHETLMAPAGVAAEQARDADLRVAQFVKPGGDVNRELPRELDLMLPDVVQETFWPQVGAVGEVGVINTMRDFCWLNLDRWVLDQRIMTSLSRRTSRRS
jgi:hypothetical protein